ncbi:hypothetical protein [Sandaracinus amylolyticus]|uniref:hypothetical protein n=1 Tax=Sandaracinus amylolyticus TaxID=927083 RepID=UPI001F3F590B|nr:hypothetical protein [Sandaracinus amylolyticus]UJR85156.1 Hypothetical protein I5071_72360 [Sandaracinus amylolyticus]
MGDFDPPPLASDGPAWRAHKRAIRAAGRRACIAALLPIVRAQVPVLRDARSAVSNQADRFLSPREAGAVAERLLDAIARWIDGAGEDDVREVVPSSWSTMLGGRGGAAGSIALAVHALCDAVLSRHPHEQAVHAVVASLASAGVPLGQVDAALRAAYRARFTAAE